MLEAENPIRETVLIFPRSTDARLMEIPFAV
jgi:hypothetical protein